MPLRSLDLDLEVFHGPFDLLLTLVLRDEIDLLEVDLAEVVLAYVEHLEEAGRLDLEATTEFLVLIAPLLGLRSRLLPPVEEEEGMDFEPGEAADELLARMLEYSRYRSAADMLRELLLGEHGYRYRSAPPPPAGRPRLPRPPGPAPAAAAARVGGGRAPGVRARAARARGGRPPSHP